MEANIRRMIEGIKKVIYNTFPQIYFLINALMGNKQAAPTRKRTCEICFEEKLPVPASVYKNNKNCIEAHPFCQDCISKHIMFKIEAKTAVVRCPGVECPVTLDPVACRSVIPRDNFVEWCDILVDTYIASRGHRRAVCPYQGCSEVVIDECKGGGRQDCPKCKGPFCFGCGVVWTNNHHRSCSFEERVFLNAARLRKWKRCPRCRFFVQRRSGCNSITCRCGATFCYRCGAENCRCKDFIFCQTCFITVVLLSPGVLLMILLHYK